MKLKITLLFLFFLRTSLLHSQEFEAADASTLKEMFELAFANQGTGPSYLVIKAINDIDNTEKEICLSGEDLYWALLIEHPNCINNIDSVGLSNSISRTFRFSNISALNKIDFYNYNDSILKELRLDISDAEWGKIYKEARQIQKRQIKPEYNSKKTFLFYTYLNDYGIYFIHLLFERGILTGRSCLDGSIYISGIFQTSK
jgi:hypothetical protein